MNPRSERSEPSELAFTSGGTLAGVRLCLPCDRQRLRRQLRRFGPLDLRPLDDYPSAQHPLCCELWQITRGRLELLGLDQHQWSTRLGRAAGLWSAWAGNSWSAALEDAVSEGAMQISRSASRVFGTHHELQLVIPEVCFESAPGEAYNFVVGMISDSWVARLGDRLLGFGYYKEPGRVECDGHGGWRVLSVAGEPLLSVRARVVGGAPSAEVLGQVNAGMRAPMLGGWAGGVCVASQIRRNLFAPRVRVAAAAAELRLDRDLTVGLTAGYHSIRPGQAPSRWDPIACSELLARVSYPWRVGPPIAGGRRSLR